MNNLIEIKKLFNIEKGSLQSSKCIAGKYNFITASSEWKKHSSYTHDCEALIIAVAASGSLGRVHYVKGKFIASDLCFILTPRSVQYPLDLIFYKYIFEAFKEDLVKSLATGSSKLAINKANFGKYKLPYVDIDSQNILRKKLVMLISKRDKLANLNYIQKILIGHLRQQMLQDAISGKLSENWRIENQNIESATTLLEKVKMEKEKLIKERVLKKELPLSQIQDNDVPFELPKKWVWCRLGEVGIFERGKSKHRPRNDESLFSNGTYPFVQTGDVSQSKKNNFIISTCNKKYNDIGLGQSKLWKKGTLCITIAANIAETGFLDMDACFPDSVVGFTSLIEKELAHYIRFYIEATRDEIEKFAPATAQKNINLGIINELIFPLPPKEEIIQIVQKVNLLSEKLNTIKVNNKNIVKLTDSLSKTALQNIFSI